MTDTNREHTPPQIPTHESQPLDISPTPSKSIHRSKTVRNLNSAGNKMKGFFGKKKESKSKTEENAMPARPVLSTSASYGPTTANNYVQQLPPPPPLLKKEMNIEQAHQEQKTPASLPANEQQEQQTTQQQIAPTPQQNQVQQQQQQVPPPTQQQQQQVPPQAQQPPPPPPTSQQQQQVPQSQQSQPQQQQNQIQPQPLQQQQQQQQQVPPQQQAPQPQQVPTPQQQPLSQQQQRQQQINLQLELEQLNELINVRQLEVQNEKKNKERLQNELAEAQRIFKEREAEYSAIEHSFFEHTRAIRATDDDLSTIRDSFKLLKYSIARLIMTLNKKADKARATEKFCQTWPNLPILDPTTKELEPSFINLLAEKLVHEHLVRDVFSLPIYPGLKVNDAYKTLNTWLQQHNSSFSVRLRQQMAAVVAKSKPESDIQQTAQKEKQTIANKIYDDLADIYHPFLRENDASVEEEKSYLHKICDIVDKALKLTIAIRGQEVDITTVPIEEGSKQPFEEETMTEVKGRTEGLVRFCICPAFIGGDREHGFLEKGKVVISN